jgi:hypothetical protein
MVRGRQYKTLAICRSLALAHAAFKVAIAENPAARFMIRNRTRVDSVRPLERFPVGLNRGIP